MVNLETLKNFISITGINFQFETQEDYKPIIFAVYEKIKDCDIETIKNKFENLWKITNKEWNDEYGYRGRPSIGRWLEILVEKPLTDEEIEKRKIEYEENLRFKASIIGVWCNDPNLLISFPQRYKNPENEHIKLVIDTYCKVKEKLPDERIKKMAIYLKKELDQDKALFYDTLKGIAREKQPLLLT
jgi:hypothetical protein